MTQTANQIAEAVMKWCHDKGQPVITTSFTGMGLGECDVLSITGSGYIHEFEIKRSRSDYQRDFTEKPYKHDNMKRGGGMRTLPVDRFRKREEYVYQSANYFWFVTPIMLVQLEDLPPYAGLLYVTLAGKVEVIRSAPVIHRYKAIPELVTRVAHNLSNKLIFGSTYTKYVADK